MYGWWYSVMDTFISYSLTLHWSVLYSVQLILHKELMLNLWREGWLNKDTFCTEQFLPTDEVVSPKGCCKSSLHNIEICQSSSCWDRPDWRALADSLWAQGASPSSCPRAGPMLTTSRSHEEIDLGISTGGSRLWRPGMRDEVRGWWEASHSLVSPPPPPTLEASCQTRTERYHQRSH